MTGSPAGAALELSEVSVRFGGLLALDGVDFCVGRREIVGLIGPNGAGKTTLLNVITGLIRPDRGRVLIGGQDCSRQSVHGRARRGLARTFQRVSLFPELTVRSHVLLANEARVALVRRSGGREAAALRKTGGRGRDGGLTPTALLARVGLRGPGTTDVRSLPLGSARQVELAMGLAALPAILILDEPLSGLVGVERQELCDLLSAVREEQDLAIVLVEHDVESVARLVDRIVVLNFGRKIADGSPAEVLALDEVRSAYFGSVPTP